MKTMVTTGDGMHINDGPGWPGQLRIERERIDISSNSPKVDRSWTFTDAAGHFHAATEDKREPWPTLRMRIEERPCGFADHDEDCDGENVTHWHCLICDEEIAPGMKPGPHYESMAGMESWEARVSVPVEQVNGLLGQRVSVRLESDGGTAWGVALVRPDFSYTSDSPTMDLHLDGVSALGRRKAVTARV